MATRIKTQFKNKHRVHKAMGGYTPKAGKQPYTGSYITGSLAGTKVSNPSLVHFYGDKIKP
jgi:hypothetical protein|tara:strand:+ start:235 stop:417 length:183 start_codon:yes stop_codon:yes gene_type:complete